MAAAGSFAFAGSFTGASLASVDWAQATVQGDFVDGGGGGGAGLCSFVEVR
jgi:hypothetical protein